MEKQPVFSRLWKSLEFSLAVFLFYAHEGMSLISVCLKIAFKAWREGKKKTSFQMINLQLYMLVCD